MYYLENTLDNVANSENRRIELYYCCDMYGYKLNWKYNSVHNILSIL